jgi:NTE family protein
MTEGPGHPEAASPVTPGGADKAEPGVALCLSGGGYRAMLFHLGALWRLNELGFLPRLDRVSSVSGGSIVAATLGQRWDRLRVGDDGIAQAFASELVAPVRRLASTTIDRGSVLGGLLQPKKTVAEKVAEAYRKHLFGTDTLQRLPDRPRFVLNATNVQTGSLWRFSKPYMADYQVGLYPKPDVELAVAVGASSAFPPVLSPVRLTVDEAGYSQEGRGALFRAPFTTNPVLSDGGVYDNLGLETAWKRYDTILISDGGGHMPPEGSVHSDWARHGLRINALIDNQVRSLRKLQAIEGFKSGARKGAYWGIRTDVAGYDPPGGALPCPREKTLTLAATKTRLERLPDERQEQLINWGYAACDAGMRTYVDRSAAAPARFPYPACGVG